MNPKKPPPIPGKNDPPPLPDSSILTPKDGGVSPGKATYNIVTDIVTGINFRGSDNKFQALFILGAMIILSLVGTILAVCIPSWTAPWYAGAIGGAVLGLLVGFFLSGIYLMIYRGARHIKGNHD